MKLIKTACALAAMAITSATVWAESVDVKVIGTIAPSSCTPTISGDIDYGNISPSILSQDDFTQLDSKHVKFTIRCDAPTRLALKARNGRPGTTAGTIYNNDDGVSPPSGMNNGSGLVVGLGMSGDKKIGGYSITLSEIFADDKPVTPITRGAAPADHWIKVPILPLYKGFEIVSSWSSNDTITPSTFTNMTAMLNVRAYINKRSELNIGTPIKLDGLTTIELFYL